MTAHNIPFAWCERGTKFTKYCSLKYTFPKTIKKYMQAVAAHVENKFKSMVTRDGEVLPLVMTLDMWDDKCGNKYLGVFVVYPDAHYSKPVYFLLCCTPLLDETTSCAAAQCETIREALRRCGLEINHFNYIVADNTAVNPAIARVLGLPFVGCASHRLALAIGRLLNLFMPAVTAVHELQKKLRGSNYRGLLRQQGCHLTPKILGHKWGAAYEMIVRSVLICKKIIFLLTPVMVSLHGPTDF